MPELEIYQIQNLLAAGIEIGMKRMAIELGAIKPSISKAEAYRRYGEGTVDRWIREGLISPKKDGDHSSKMKLDRMELEILRTSSNRTTYLPTSER